MYTTIRISALLLLLASCDFKSSSPDEMMNEIREDFAKEAEINNAKHLAWENLVDSLYEVADTNSVQSIEAIDKLLSNNGSLDQHQISELHFIKGDIYYANDSFQMSVDEFTLAGQATNMGAPKYLAARAGAFVKLKQYDSAWTDINRAVIINYDYGWNLGNFYEVIGIRDSAISCYTRLYQLDTTYYKFCIDRVHELESNAKTYTEFVFRDRERMMILMRSVE